MGGDRTNAERQRRYIARLKAQAAQAGVSNAPAGPDHAALVQELAQAKARIVELEQELAAAKARIAELERELTSERERRAAEAKAAPRDNKDDRIAELEEEIRGLRLHIRFGPKRRPAEPKAAKPPLPPDEERDRIIKGLKTRVRNLTAELHHTREWMAAAKSSGMSFNTRNTILKPMHPDSRKHLTGAEHLPGTELEAALDAGVRAFTAWADGLKPARR
jgi:hypothetical protein